jgi:Transcription antiterminator
MAEVLDKKWYVVRAVSGQEHKIKGYIETEVERQGFKDHLEEVLVPIEKVVQIRNGKKYRKSVLIFLVI